jgi:phosphate starvation-inducible protein PhoH
MWLISAMQYDRDGEMERIFLIEPLLQADDVLIVIPNDSMLD